MSKGYSFETFAAVINVARSTMYKWKEIYPEFSEAKEIAFAKSQHFFEQRLMAKLYGQKINGVTVKDIDTACLIFALKTRFRKDYSERLEIAESQNEGLAITIKKHEKKS